MYNENDTVAKYEIMDGAPVRGELLLEWYVNNVTGARGVHTDKTIPVWIWPHTNNEGY